MLAKSQAQIEQEQIMEAAGLGREDLEVLYEECGDKLVEVENDLMDIAEDKIYPSPRLHQSRLPRLPHRQGRCCSPAS